MQAINYFWSLLHWAKWNVYVWASKIKVCSGLWLPSPKLRPCSSLTQWFRDEPGLHGSLIPLSPQKTCQCLLGLACHGVMLPAVPSASSRCVFQQKVIKSAFVSLHRFGFFFLALSICSRLYQLFPFSARSQLFTWEKETIHPPFLGAKSCPSSGPPPAATGIWFPPVWGFELAVGFFTPCDSSCLWGFFVCVLFGFFSPFGRIICAQRGPWHLYFSLDLCDVMGSPWLIAVTGWRVPPHVQKCVKGVWCPVVLTWGRGLFSCFFFSLSWGLLLEMHPHLPGPALLDIRIGTITDEALQEGLQITNNCVINTCKQPFGSWLINFHGPFYHCLQRKEGSGFRMLLVGCGPVLTPLPCWRFGCNPELCTHLAHAPVFPAWEGNSAHKMC